MTVSRTKTSAFTLSRQQRFRLYALGTAGLIALGLGMQNARAQEMGVEEVSVTGTRIVRDGYSAPTPVTVIGEQAIQAEAPANLADFVNKLPSVVGSTTPNNSQGSLSAGTAGLNALNLRALGTTRTLVLLNGHRSSPSASTGEVDINTFPQELVSRVDVVTGGASADYGSDAVGGVVNFILDTKFTGLKGNAEYGETTYGENPSYKASLTYGAEFDGGRGHALLSGQVYTAEGIAGNGRNFNKKNYFRIQNPAYTATNGQPFYLIGPGAFPSQVAPGGLVVSGAQQGTYFGVNASVNKLAYGATSGPWMIGGDGQVTTANYVNTLSLASSELRQNIFGRASYEIFPDVEVYAQASYSKWHGKSFYMGDWANVGGVTIARDNAFLPASVAAQIPVGQSLTIGTTNSGLPPPGSNNNRSVMRVSGGATGTFNLFTDWKWDLYGQNSTTELHEQTLGNWNTSRMAAAQDAVLAPGGNAAGIAAGTIVCRSTLTAPTNGCAPLSRIGINGGTQSAAAFQQGINYIAGAVQPFRDETLEEQSFGFNVTGNPLENWAGPISIAFGAEWRKESINGTVDPQYRSGWLYGNYLVNVGHYSVAEGYLSTVVPIMKGMDATGAIRYTAYSTSGGVNTWKMGLNYAPIDDAKFRFTYSHDIRAPNLNELFAAGTARANTVLINNISYAFQESNTGNPNLKPEAANSLGAGVVLSPRWIPGLTASVDYYNISLKQRIGSISAQNVANLCYELGVTSYCSNIISTGSGAGLVVSTIRTQPINFASSKAQGLDFDVTYDVPLEAFDSLVGPIPGSLSLHGLATNYIQNYVNDGFNPPTDVAGVNIGNGTPDWIYRVSATYATDPWLFDLTGRGVSGGKYANEYVVCTTGCPASTVANRTANMNSIAGAFLVDATVTYSFDAYGAGLDTYFSVKNMFNTDPPPVGNGPDGLNTPAYNQTNNNLYDTIGRTFRLGVRMKM